MHSTVGIKNGVAGSGHRSAIRYIDLHANDVAARIRKLLHRAVQPPLLHVTERHPHALTCKHAGHGKTDPAGGASNKRRFACQVIHCR
jgi:hypothetical protein